MVNEQKAHHYTKYNALLISFMNIYTCAVILRHASLYKLFEVCQFGLNLEQMEGAFRETGHLEVYYLTTIIFYIIVYWRIIYLMAYTHLGSIRIESIDNITRKKRPTFGKCVFCNIIGHSSFILGVCISILQVWA